MNTTTNITANAEIKILFVCTHNRCRSILFEAICNDLAEKNNYTNIKAFSAGSDPAGEVHPLSLHYLQQNNIATDGLHSKSYDAFDNNLPNIVITVCDKAAGEPCPVWFGDPSRQWQIKLHWGLEDPSITAEENIESAFNQTIEEIKKRSSVLLSTLNSFEHIDKTNYSDVESILKQKIDA